MYEFILCSTLFFGFQICSFLFSYIYTYANSLGATTSMLPLVEDSSTKAAADNNNNNNNNDVVNIGPVADGEGKKYTANIARVRLLLQNFILIR